MSHQGNERSTTDLTIVRPNQLPPCLEAGLLPWEDASELLGLHAEFVAEHRPEGPTERHLVEQLVLLAWRKRRVASAERALHLDTLHSCSTSFSSRLVGSATVVAKAVLPREYSATWALLSDDADDAQMLAELEAEERMTLRALQILQQGGKGAYERALATLYESTREWWAQCLGGAAAGRRDDADKRREREAWAATPVDLQRFLESKVLEAHREERDGIVLSPAVRRQAFGESLDPDRAGKLQAYDLRLDRQFERTLATLLQLQAARRTINARPAPIAMPGRVTS